jgi:hypothetical protein
MLLPWSFSLAGGWKQIEDSPFSLFSFDSEEGTEEGGSVEARYTAAGYAAPSTSHSDFLTVACARRETEFTKQWPFVVDVTLDDSPTFTVFVDSFPAVVELLGKLTPIKLVEILDRLEELKTNYIEPFTKKAFQAMHGHDLWSSCEQCDPGAIQRRREANRRNRKPQQPEAREPEAQ